MSLLDPLPPPPGFQEISEKGGKTSPSWTDWFFRLYKKLQTITVLPTLGSSNQLLGVNSAGTDLEYKTLGTQTVAGTLPAVSGGTGISSYAVGDMLYASAAATLSKLADVSAGSFLRSGGVTTAPAWSTTKWTNSATTGDLLYASASNTYSNLADVAAGSYLRSGGVSTAPLWSTTTLPNSATTGDLLYASASNVYSNLADVATGQLLKSGGAGVAPAWGTFSATGDATGAYGAAGLPLTLATVNSNVGTFGSATQVAQFIVNAKGLITAAANVTVTPAASSITGAGDLTKTDDTNVTLALGGTPTGSLLKAVSLTLGWAGTLAVSRGGSGAGTFTSHGVLLGQGTSAFAATAAMTDGQLLVGQSSADPLPKTISGDVTFTAAGASTVANIAGTAVSGTTGTGNVAFSASPTFTGTLNCAAITPTGLVDISGASAGQIKFPATQNASSNVNTLDDYEEGTFTPAITFGTPGNLSVSYAVQTAAYRKIGAAVSIVITFITSTFTHTTASGDSAITGLPFSALNTTNLLPQLSTSFGGVNKAGYTAVTAQVVFGSTSCGLFASGMGSIAATVTAADMPTGGTVDIRCGGVYAVAT